MYTVVVIFSTYTALMLNTQDCHASDCIYRSGGGGVVVSSDQIICPAEGLYLRKFDLRSKPSGTIKTRQLANLRGISVFNQKFK